MGGEVLMGDNVPSRLKLLRSACHYISVLTVNMQEKFAQNRPIYIIYSNMHIRILYCYKPVPYTDGNTLKSSMRHVSLKIDESRIVASIYW